MPPLPNHSAGRSAITCRFRCDSACAHAAPNVSGNPSFEALTLSRRGLLRAGMVLGFVGAAAATVGCTPVSAPLRPVPGTAFPPVPPNTADSLTVPAGYTSSVVIRWGDPVLPGAPAFDPANQSGDAQALQFGYNCDFCGLVPDGEGRWAMYSNHEYVTPSFMFAGYDEANPTEEQYKIMLNAVGGSVVAVKLEPTGSITPVPDDRLNRRITAGTPFQLTGPAAGSDFMKTSLDPAGRTALGTHSNCAGGVTPWGTILSGEENFNSFFANAAAVTDPVAVPRIARYGFPKEASEALWERFDPRWDLAKEPNAANTYGFIVEIDPLDPASTPVKHTALGRLKHEGANVRIAPDGRVVAYMGDDERFDYLYKFVSKNRYVEGDRAANKTLLTEGDLYVAQLVGDSPQDVDGSGNLPADGRFGGTGTWLPLVQGGESKVPEMTVPEILTFTRLAADKVGPTKMDRPEDIEPHPTSSKVYVALTNNTDRGADGKAAADEPNPRKGNKHGHILELTEQDNDATRTSFTWSVFMLCGDPAAPDTYFAGFDKSQVSPISTPDNLAFDKHGNLWIATDGNALKSNDGLHAVPTEGPERGKVKQFLTVPVGGEACGPVIEEKFVLVSVQHPGESDDATYAAPASRWPDGGTAQPRPSVAVVYRTDPPGTGIGV